MKKNSQIVLIQLEKPKISKFWKMQNFENISMDMGCGCPKDQDRITKIEYDSNLMKFEFDKLL